MLAGAVVPTAPLLVARGSAGLPEALRPVADAVQVTLRSLPRHDVAVLLAAGDEPGVRAGADADLAGIGRPDLRLVAPVDHAAVSGVAAATRLRVVDEPQPLGHTVLTHLYAAVGGTAPVVAVAVAASATPETLQCIGAGIEAALRDRHTVVLAAGDLSAGLSERAPLALVAGARTWDDEVVDIVGSGRLARLARLGPGEAQRVGALGWAPLVVLDGVCRAARLGTVVRRYAAPRGVGYLVARAG